MAVEFGSYLLLRRLFSFAEPVATLGIFHKAVNLYSTSEDKSHITKALFSLLIPACLVTAICMAIVLLILRYQKIIDTDYLHLLAYSLLLIPYGIYLIYYSYIRGAISSIESDLIQIIAIGFFPLIMYYSINSKDFIYYNILTYLGCFFFFFDKRFFGLLINSLTIMKNKEFIIYKKYLISGIQYRAVNIIQHNLIFLTIPFFTAITYGSIAIIPFSIFIYVLKISESIVEGLTRSAGLILNRSFDNFRLSSYVIFLILIFFDLGIFFGSPISRILSDNISFLQKYNESIELAVYFMPFYLGYILLRPICELHESKEKSSFSYVVTMLASHLILFYPLNLNEKYSQFIPFFVFIIAYTTFFIINIIYLNLEIMKSFIRIYKENKILILINFSLILLTLFLKIEDMHRIFIGSFALLINFCLVFKNEKNFIHYTHL